jgi:DNA-binding transcriptional LysR family regulator
MLNLNDVHLFVQIVEHGGFSAAGRALHLPKSTSSHRIRALETALGVRLLDRSSRQLALTAIGEAFYVEAVDMVRLAESAAAVVRARTSEPSGLVRYTTTVPEAQLAMQPALGDFLKRHPKICLLENTSAGEIDLFSGTFDVAIRTHREPLLCSHFIHRVLATTHWHVFASQAYLADANPIRDPKDLPSHPSLIKLGNQPSAAWTLGREGGVSEEHVLHSAPRIITDNIASLKAMALAGLGVTALPAYVCNEEVRSGALVRVLPEWTAGHSTVSALVPESRGPLPAVRAFLDHLAVALPQVLKAGRRDSASDM